MINIILDIQQISIPGELEERSNDFAYLILATLFASFALLAIARLVRPNIYSHLLLCSTKIGGLRSYVKEALPLNKRGSILLLINYIISSSVIMILWQEILPSDYTINEALIAGVPVMAFLFNLVSMEFAGWMIGERDSFVEPKMIKVIGAEMNGVIYFIIALIWILNDSLDSYLWQIAIWVFFVELGFRIFKSAIIVFSKGVAWYYIILYLCTLEILPLFIAYYLLVARDFA